MNRLADQVAVVTGGAGGIGRAVAAGMAAEGAAVVIADLNLDAAQTAAQQLEEQGAQALGVAADVSKRQDVEQLAEAAETQFGTPSIVFCSAGITNAGGTPDVLDLTDDEWQRIMEVNVSGTFITAQVFARRMVATGLPGSIITVSSIGGERPMIGAPAYHTSKAAVSGLTRALAVNLAHHGIRANAIAPGYIETPMLQDVLASDPRQKDQLLSRVPIGRLGAPDELVSLAVFLGSPESSYVTGQVVHVDGGALVLGWTPARANPATNLRSATSAPPPDAPTEHRGS